MLFFLESAFEKRDCSGRDQNKIFRTKDELFSTKILTIFLFSCVTFKDSHKSHLFSFAYINHVTQKEKLIIKSHSLNFN